MIYNFVSSKVVVARVQRIIEGSAWIGPGMMYLGDGIQEIGFASQRTFKAGNEKITIVNHQAEIPCDLEFLEKVVYDGCRLPINKDSSMLALSCDDFTWGKSDIADWYDIQPPLIRTSFEEGEIELFYRKYEQDDSGFILIPDIAEYRNALVWYVVQHLILEGYSTKGGNITHQYAVGMYEKYVPKARKQAKRMSRDERERFARAWNSINTEYIERTLMDNN